MTHAPTPVLAAWRDASWWPKPGVAKRYHIIAESGWAACNQKTGMLCDLPGPGGPGPAARIPSQLRCQRNGCRQRWPDRFEQ